MIAGQISPDISNTLVIILQGVIAVCQTMVLVLTRKRH
jgi:hypothetical protein